MHVVVMELFPLIRQIGKTMMSSLEEEAGHMLHLVLKSYYASIQYELPAAQQDPAYLVPWGNLFMEVISKEIPLSCVPEDLNEREACSWWKAKKWAYHSIYLLHGKYS